MATDHRSHRPIKRVYLRPHKSFVSNPKVLIAHKSDTNPEAIVATYINTYCAGMSERGTPESVLNELKGRPNIDSTAGKTVRWLLGSIKVREASSLITRCGVPIIKLVEHLKAHQLTRADLNKWLNQFAVADTD